MAPCLTLGKLGCARMQLVCTQQASRVKLGLCKAVTLRKPTHHLHVCSLQDQSLLSMSPSCCSWTWLCRWVTPVHGASPSLHHPAPSSPSAQHPAKPRRGVPAAPATQVLAAWDQATPQQRRLIPLDVLWGWMPGRRAWPALAAVQHIPGWLTSCELSKAAPHLTGVHGCPTTLLHPLHPARARGPRAGQGPLPTSSPVEMGPGFPSHRLLRSLPPARGG